MNTQELKDRIIKKLGGYTTTEVRQERIRHARNLDHMTEEIERVERMNIDAIVAAVNRVRMVTVEYEGPDTFAFVGGVADSTTSPTIKTRQPPKPNWYAVTAHIDVAALQRIYEDLMMRRQSIELEYFIDKLLHELKSTIKVAMMLSR